MFIQRLFDDPPYFFAVVITVVVSISLHELAHGAVAVWRGDRTPIETGHMTPNPAVHLGLFSVIALLMAGIAWGSMPINPGRMRGKYSEALVAAAGPACNVLLALVALASVGFWVGGGRPLEQGTPAGNFQNFLWVFGYVNVHLALFNLIPVPPLDGSRIVGNFSRGYAELMDRLAASGGMIIVFIVAVSLSMNVTGPASAKIAAAIVNAARGV